jgi:hypothetical protein
MCSLDAAQWAALPSRLAAARDAIRALLADTHCWPGEDKVTGAIAMIVHGAYPLAETRQALCSIRR